MIYWIARRLLAPLGHELPYRRSYLALDFLFVSVTVALVVTLGASVRMVGASLLVLYTLIVSLTDFSCLIIPNRLTYTCALIGLVLALVDPQISLLQSLSGGLAGLTLFWTIAVAGSKVFKRRAMGGGDIKLAAMLGLFTGPAEFLMVLFLGSCLGLGYTGYTKLRRRDISVQRIPFGPFLAIAGLIAYLTGDRLLSAYLLTVGA